MLVRCNCTHLAQDSLHGPKVRVANELSRKDGGPQQLRCTVCGAIHQAAPDAAPSKANKANK